jgi:magnesium transporter
LELHLVVSEEGRLRGLVDAGSLLGAEPDTPVLALAKAAGASVGPSTSAERAAWLAAHANATAVAVVDDQHRCLGLIPASRLLALMVHEHEVDLARIGGFLRGTRRARTAGEEAVVRRVWHRLPWLLVGLLGAVAAAQIVSVFEGDLAETVTLAFFLPGIVYMADAVGTQTETLVIRGLSVGVSQSKIFRLEALTGGVIGVFLSVAIFPLALLVTGDTAVATVVSLALFASASTATVVAVSLPSLMERLDVDPAFGSGPLATVIQDILSITIYFAMAVLILGD